MSSADYTPAANELKLKKCVVDFLNDQTKVELVLKSSTFSYQSPLLLQFNIRVLLKNLSDYLVMSLQADSVELKKTEKALFETRRIFTEFAFRDDFVTPEDDYVETARKVILKMGKPLTAKAIIDYLRSANIISRLTPDPADKNAKVVANVESALTGALDRDIRDQDTIFVLLEKSPKLFWLKNYNPPEEWEKDYEELYKTKVPKYASVHESNNIYLDLIIELLKDNKNTPMKASSIVGTLQNASPYKEELEDKKLTINLIKLNDLIEKYLFNFNNANYNTYRKRIKRLDVFNNILCLKEGYYNLLDHDIKSDVLGDMDLSPELEEELITEIVEKTDLGVEEILYDGKRSFEQDFINFVNSDGEEMELLDSDGEKVSPFKALGLISKFKLTGKIELHKGLKLVKLKPIKETIGIISPGDDGSDSSLVAFLNAASPFSGVPIYMTDANNFYLKHEDDDKSRMLDWEILSKLDKRGVLEWKDDVIKGKILTETL